MRNPRAMAAGDPTAPDIASLLAELQALLCSEGVDVARVSAVSLTTLRKAPRIGGRKPVAIPRRELWPNIVPAARYLSALPHRVHIYNGYRPPDYNAAVGGSKRSKHMEFSAIDFYGTDDRRAVALAVAFDHANEADPGGFGVYGRGRPALHVDGSRRRQWGDAAWWIEQVS